MKMGDHVQARQVLQTVGVQALIDGVFEHRPRNDVAEHRACPSLVCVAPQSGGTDPNDDPAFFVRMFRDYLDEEYALGFPAATQRANRSSGEERDSHNCSQCCGTPGRMAF